MRHIILACVLVLAACDDGGPGAQGENVPPIAALTASTDHAGLGDPVDFSADGSRDDDGYIATYRFIYGDGSPASLTGSPGATHAFAAAGVYTVTLVVVDDRGAQAEATTVVTVDDEPPTDQCGEGLPPCDEPLTCMDGTCQCPEDSQLCDGACVDTRFDHMNCGDCGHACGDEQSCQGGECVDGPSCGELTECDGECVDTTMDPFNCDGCGEVCDSGVCQDSQCTAALPPGTLLETFPPPPFTVTRGLTNLGGTWYMTSGRRFVEFDPETGQSSGDWFIDDQQGRRAYGLAGFDSANQGPLLFTGSYDRFGDPRQDVNLDVYAPFSAGAASISDGGGPCAFDGTQLYVFSNEHRTLLVFDPDAGTMIDTIPISGFADDDWFTDLALDGQGGAWLTRPTFPGFAPLLAKIDLATGAFLQYFDAPDLDGLGGIELVDGELWGIGAGGTYRMVP